MTKVILSVEPIRFPLTGIGRYTLELAKALATDKNVDELLLFGATRFLDAIPEPVESASKVHRLKGWIQKSRLATEAYRLITPVIKQRALRDYQDFLFHSPNFYLPPFPGRRLTTFHDLSPFTWPDCIPPERRRFMQKELELAVKRAEAFITDSEFNRRELAAYFGLPLTKVFAIPLASGEEFHPRSVAELTPILSRYSLLPEGYSLYVGTIEPRKNLKNLLAAYECLSLSLRRRYPLILAGYHGWQSEEIHVAIERATRQGWARYLGFVPSSDLPFLIAGARLFCFPSYYEGFGLPVLEAMSSGVPVVCSNSSSLPEVAGDAALMVEPEDVDTLSAHITRGLQDESWRSHARESGLARAGSFSWRNCARSTLNVYEHVMSD